MNANTKLYGHSLVTYDHFDAKDLRELFICDFY